jgi:MFS family permease
MALLALGIALTGALLASELPPWITVPAWGVAGLGIGLAYTTVALVILEQAPPGGEGAASAALQLANVLGTAAGTGASGALVATLAGGGESMRMALAVVGALTLLLALLGLAAVPRLRERACTT